MANAHSVRFNAMNATPSLYEMKKVHQCSFIIPLSACYPILCNAAGVVGGIEAAGSLAVLAAIYGVLSLVVGILLVFPIYKKFRKTWIWALGLIPTVWVFIGLWLFTFTPYAKPIISVINTAVGKNLSMMHWHKERFDFVGAEPLGDFPAPVS
jgi:hypothetical protein